MILMHVATVPEFFGFFHGQFAYMKAHGFEVHAVSSPGKMLQKLATTENIFVHPINIPRFISPLADVKALYNLYRFFLHLKPTIVHAHTTKGGLLGVLAARMAHVPVVIYGMHGTRFLNEVGVRRWLYIFLETLMCRVADRVIAVSFSNKNRAVAAKLCRENKIVVLASGSTNGVNAKGQFSSEIVSPGTREAIRLLYHIPVDATVLGFVSRIVRFKGIVELAEAWQILRDRFPNLFLLLVGWIEEHDPVPPDILKKLKVDSRVVFTGAVDDTVPLYRAMDILVYPSHREGFPVSPLEAAAMELPVVTTTADGCIEAVKDGITGLLVSPGDSDALAEAIQKLLLNPEMGRQMGDAGRKWVMRYFMPEPIWHALYDNYVELVRFKLKKQCENKYYL